LATVIFSAHRYHSAITHQMESAYAGFPTEVPRFGDGPIESHEHARGAQYARVLLGDGDMLAANGGGVEYTVVAEQENTDWGQTVLTSSDTYCVTASQQHCGASAVLSTSATPRNR